MFGRSDAHSRSPEENEFAEEEPVLVLSPEEPGPGPATIDCPRDCACSQEGVVDCGGIDLREFPGDLPEHTNHLSLQVRRLRDGRWGCPCARGPSPGAPVLMAAYPKCRSAAGSGPGRCTPGVRHRAPGPVTRSLSLGGVWAEAVGGVRSRLKMTQPSSVPSEWTVRASDTITGQERRSKVTPIQGSGALPS